MNTTQERERIARRLAAAEKLAAAAKALISYDAEMIPGVWWRTDLVDALTIWEEAQKP